MNGSLSPNVKSFAIQKRVVKSDSFLFISYNFGGGVEKT